MITNLSLGDMILQYSENPFIDERIFSKPALSNSKYKQGVLGRLFLLPAIYFLQNNCKNHLNTKGGMCLNK